jgi:hypothetical protein
MSNRSFSFIENSHPDKLEKKKITSKPTKGHKGKQKAGISLESTVDIPSFG